jgi:hypothetical protein
MFPLRAFAPLPLCVKNFVPFLLDLFAYFCYNPIMILISLISSSSRSSA